VSHDPLRLCRENFASAEKTLLRARENMSSAAERAGISQAGLFGDSLYVSRVAAERWERKAREKGRQEIVNTLGRVREAMASGTPLRNVDLRGFRGDAERLDDPDELAQKILAAGRKRRGES